MSQLRVNADRLWLTLMEMAKIGALPHGGCRRLALSEEDRQGRELFIAWCREAGCSIRVDAAGNIFARRPGADDSLPAAATGSHLDTQPHGGRFDGIYGVLAGLEVIRTLNDADIVTHAPVETIVWTNEEGVRFDPSCAGSAVFTRVMSAQVLHSAVTIDGGTVGGDLERCGYLGLDVSFREHPLSCFIEAHIEQGPILEAEGLTVGVVTGIQGACMYTVQLTGMDGHAGTTPMAMRRDALVGAARIVAWLNRMAVAADPDIRLTVGRLNVEPNAPSTIPGSVSFDIELRHPSEAALEVYSRKALAGVRRLARGARTEAAVQKVFAAPPVVFDASVVEEIEARTQAAGYTYRRMQSGAGHDAGFLAGVTPTGMIFVPCEGGLSHNEAENAKPEDLAAGATVLLHALLAQAKIEPGVVPC